MKLFADANIALHSDDVETLLSSQKTAKSSADSARDSRLHNLAKDIASYVYSVHRNDSERNDFSGKIVKYRNALKKEQQGEETILNRQSVMSERPG